MTKGLVRSLSRGPVLQQLIIKRTIDFSLAFTLDGTAVGFGGAVITDFPEGNVLLMGTVINYTITSVDADISDTFDADISVGSTPASDGTLTAGDTDIIPSTTVPQAVGKATSGRAASTTAESGTILDNTDGSLEVNLNVLVDDADISADADMIATGQLYIAYTMLGDD